MSAQRNHGRLPAREECSPPSESAQPRPRFIWNASESVPTGLYSVQPARQLTVITLVVAYPPEPLATHLADSGYLPRAVPLIKHVLALPGQTVSRIGLATPVDVTDAD